MSGWRERSPLPKASDSSVDVHQFLMTPIAQSPSEGVSSKRKTGPSSPRHHKKSTSRARTPDPHWLFSLWLVELTAHDRQYMVWLLRTVCRSWETGTRGLLRNLKEREDAERQQAALWLALRIDHGEETWRRVALSHFLFPHAEALEQWELKTKINLSPLRWWHPTEMEFIERQYRNAGWLKSLAWDRGTWQRADSLPQAGSIQWVVHGTLLPPEEVDEEEAVVPEPIAETWWEREDAPGERWTLRAVLATYLWWWMMGSSSRYPHFGGGGTAEGEKECCSWPSIRLAFEHAELWAEMEIFWRTVFQFIGVWIRFFDVHWSRLMTGVRSRRIASPPPVEEFLVAAHDWMPLVFSMSQLFHLAVVVCDENTWPRLWNLAVGQRALRKSVTKLLRVDRIEREFDEFVEHHRLVHRCEISDHWGLCMMRRLHECLMWLPAARVIQLLEELCRRLDETQSQVLASVPEQRHVFNSIARIPNGGQALGWVVRRLSVWSAIENDDHDDDAAPRWFDRPVDFHSTMVAGHFFSNHPLLHLWEMVCRYDLAPEKIKPVQTWWLDRLRDWGLDNRPPRYFALSTLPFIECRLATWSRLSWLLDIHSNWSTTDEATSDHLASSPSSSPSFPPSSPEDSVKNGTAVPMAQQALSRERIHGQRLIDSVWQTKSTAQAWQRSLFLHTLHHSNCRQHHDLRRLFSLQPQLFRECCLWLLKIRGVQWYHDQRVSWPCPVCRMCRRQYEMDWYTLSRELPLQWTRRTRFRWKMLLRKPYSFRLPDISDDAIWDHLFLDGRPEWCQGFLDEFTTLEELGDYAFRVKRELEESQRALSDADSQRGVMISAQRVATLPRPPQFLALHRLIRQSVRFSRPWHDYDLCFARVLHAHNFLLPFVGVDDELDASCCSLEQIVHLTDRVNLAKSALLHFIETPHDSSLGAIEFMAREVEPFLRQDYLFVSHAASCGDLVALSFLLHHLHFAWPPDRRPVQDLMTFHWSHHPKRVILFCRRRLEAASVREMVRRLQAISQNHKWPISPYSSHKAIHQKRIDAAYRALHDYLTEQRLLETMLRSLHHWSAVLD